MARNTASCAAPTRTFAAAGECESRAEAAAIPVCRTCPTASSNTPAFALAAAFRRAQLDEAAAWHVVAACAAASMVAAVVRRRATTDASALRRATAMRAAFTADDDRVRARRPDAPLQSKESAFVSAVSSAIVAASAASSATAEHPPPA